MTATRKTAWITSACGYLCDTEHLIAKMDFEGIIGVKISTKFSRASQGCADNPVVMAVSTCAAIKLWEPNQIVISWHVRVSIRKSDKATRADYVAWLLFFRFPFTHFLSFRLPSYLHAAMPRKFCGILPRCCTLACAVAQIVFSELFRGRYGRKLIPDA